MAVQRRPIEFRGGSLSDLRAFPAVARRRAGYQLDRLQLGLEPDDWKSMSDIGAGVRVIYVAKFQEAIYVLHCFKKKTAKTSKADIALARQRYDIVLKEHRS
ncbi:MAG TPA: type II toxin-antitoxin system RelE/ParE family toxin [Dongiaceae bacterium]|jgi:phage-related protein|nr:type II toxin-antitoxin system RelE/ParE family toxin [Dongiaceae bacterium]